MTYSMRYFRVGRADAGVVMIPRKEDFAAHKARLEASGYTGLDPGLLDPVALASDLLVGLTVDK
jgi:hypothetical protein